ncbi:MAG TPA: DUF2442 domain-containing protein [Solirubrobacteraceae bacterium]|nr:DUF2442 domain-containing protein [Solirubrobacteraceae bacterium]
MDITPLLDTEVFAPLRDPKVFEQVTVDDELGTIAWPGGADLDPSVIYAALNLGPNKAQVKVLAPSIRLSGFDLPFDSTVRGRATGREQMAALPISPEIDRKTRTF